MLIYVIDCETTGIDEDAELVEIGAVGMRQYDDGSFEVDMDNAWFTLVRPDKPIPATASAIHHITDDMVSAFTPRAAEALEDFKGADIYVAHNAKFDRRFLGALGEKWVCTMKCAHEQWPDAPSYGNQALSYWLKTNRPPESSGHAHRALYDAYTSAELLQKLFDAGWTTERMLEVSSRPITLRKMPFGKHAGMAFCDLPAGYLNWMSRQTDWSEDVDHTVRTELARRGAS